MGAPVYLVREGIKGLRGLVCMGFYSHPLVQRHLGYLPGPWIDQKVAERVSKWGLRVPDLHEVAETSGGPEGVIIKGKFREQLTPDGKPIDYKQIWGRASEEEIAAAKRAAEDAKADAKRLEALITLVRRD